MANKTNKSFAKRLKLTKNGKVVARRPGLNHFNARQSRSTQLAKKRTQKIHLTNKAIARNLPHGTKNK